MRAVEFLKLRGETYWFRRRVPLPLTGILGRREVAVSLRTGLRREAEARARVAWIWTERAFALAKGGTSIAREQALVLLRRLASDEPWHRGELDEVKALADRGDSRDVLALLTHAREEIVNLPGEERNRVLLHLERWGDRLHRGREAVIRDARAKLPPKEVEALKLKAARSAITLDSLYRVLLSDISLAKERGAVVPQDAPRVSGFVEEFIAEKSRTTREHVGYSAQTAAQARATFRLWVELMGDPPVSQVTGREAGEFRALLLRLPASHGKNVGGRGKERPEPVPALRAIELADAREAAGTDVPRLSMKTTRRHFSTMQQLWKHLLQRQHVNTNAFSGFSFPGTKAKRSLRDDWSEDDLIKLLRSPRMAEAARDGSRDFWLVAVAMWSGMRLEEICRLRPSLDISERDGVPCILIQDQELPTPWSPKTEAGERAVPLHAALLDAGFMELVEGRQGEERVVPGLVPQGPDGKLGSAFSRDFSRIKTRLGVSSRTVFHSFRHSVSTILRNQDATIREPWIDAVLGHDGDGAKSMGIAVYLKRIGAKNLSTTVAAISYPPAVQQAWQELVVVRRR